MAMDADLDPLLASRLAEELARVPAPGARPPRAARSALPVRIAVIALVILLAAAAGRELAILRTPASPASSMRGLYLGDPYGIGWLEIDPLTLANRGTRALLDLKLSPSEAAVTSADGSTIVVSHYAGLLAEHAVYDARTGTLRGRFTDREPMIVDAISADGAQVIGRVGSANHSMTDEKLIVSTTDGRIIRRVPAVDGCCEHAVLFDPSLGSVYYVLGPAFGVSGSPQLGPLTLVAQSTTTGATKTVPLPGIQAGPAASFGSLTVGSGRTLFFAATVLSPDGTRFAALSLDGTVLDIVDTASLQVTQKTLARQTSWRDLFGPLVAYGKEPADMDAWHAVFSPDGRALFAFHTQQSYSTDAGIPSVQARTLTLERIDIDRGLITAVAPQAPPFTDFMGDLLPSWDGDSVYVFQGGGFGLLDPATAPVLRRLDARSLDVEAERRLDPNSWDLRQFQQPAARPAAAAGLNVDSRGGPAIIVTVGGRDVARIPCSGGETLRPGVGDVPPLPWEMQVLRQNDRTVLLTTTVTTLPKWLLLVGDSVALSETPVAAPGGPMCSSP